MKATVQIEIQSFPVPVSVGVLLSPAKEGVPTAPSFIPLGELHPAALEELCDQFRIDVFKATGKTPCPRREPPSLLKARTMLSSLRLVLCAPDGHLVVPGSAEDREIIRRALAALDTFLNSL